MTRTTSVTIRPNSMVRLEAQPDGSIRTVPIAGPVAPNRGVAVQDGQGFKNITNSSGAPVSFRFEVVSVEGDVKEFRRVGGGPTAANQPNLDEEARAKVRTGAHISFNRSLGQRGETVVEFGSEKLERFTGHGTRTVNWTIGGREVPVTISVHPVIQSRNSPPAVGVSITVAGKVAVSKIVNT